LGIAEGGIFLHKSSSEERMLNLAQMPNRSRSVPLLAIPCCVQYILLFCNVLRNFSSKVSNLLFAKMVTLILSKIIVLKSAQGISLEPASLNRPSSESNLFLIEKSSLSKVEASHSNE